LTGTREIFKRVITGNYIDQLEKYGGDHSFQDYLFGRDEHSLDRHSPTVVALVAVSLKVEKEFFLVGKGTGMAEEKRGCKHTDERQKMRTTVNPVSGMMYPSASVHSLISLYRQPQNFS
jgi:hypothetical protein